MYEYIVVSLLFVQMAWYLESKTLSAFLQQGWCGSYHSYETYFVDNIDESGGDALRYHQILSKIAICMMWWDGVPPS